MRDAAFPYSGRVKAMRELIWGFFLFVALPYGMAYLMGA